MVHIYIEQLVLRYAFRYRRALHIISKYERQVLVIAGRQRHPMPFKVNPDY